MNGRRGNISAVAHANKDEIASTVLHLKPELSMIGLPHVPAAVVHATAVVSIADQAPGLTANKFVADVALS